MGNFTMMPYFDRYCLNDDMLEKKFVRDAAGLKWLGTAAVWLPPARKKMNCSQAFYIKMQNYTSIIDPFQPNFKRNYRHPSAGGSIKFIEQRISTADGIEKPNNTGQALRSSIFDADVDQSEGK